MKNKVSFKKEEVFFSDLKRNINDYFRKSGKSRKAGTFFYLKAFVLSLLFISSYSLIFFSEPISLIWFLNWALLGVSILLLCLNVFHDTMHHSVINNRFLNNIFSVFLKSLGLNDSIWKQLHNHEHHTYTNIEGHDSDLVDIGIIRFSGYQKWSPKHKYQHIYASVLYCFQTLVWIYKKDFQDYFKLLKNQSLQKRIDFFFFKAVHVFLFIICPFLVLEGVDIAFIILGYFISQIIFGISSTLLFLTSHIVEKVNFFPENEKEIRHSWAEHQLLTTVSYGRDSKLFEYLGGGINYQIEHHLFPGICHTHYPQISEIVKSTALRHQIKYFEYPDFMSAVKSHYTLLKKLGNPN